MNKKNPWIAMSLEELKKKEKTMKVLVILQAVAIVLLLAAGIYTFINKGFGVFTFFFLFMVPMLASGIAALTSIKKEISSRETSAVL